MKRTLSLPAGRPIAPAAYNVRPARRGQVTHAERCRLQGRLYLQSFCDVSRESAAGAQLDSVGSTRRCRDGYSREGEPVECAGGGRLDKSSRKR